MCYFPDKMLIMNNLKTCRSCGKDFPLDGFYPSSVNKDGRISYCKKCSRKKVKDYRAKRNFVPKIDGKKICRTCKGELDITEFGKHHLHLDGRNSECKKCACKRTSDRRTCDVRRKMNDSHKEWKKKNHRRVLQYQREWASKNRVHVRQEANNRYYTDINYRIASLVRSRVRMALKGIGAKSASTLGLLGCSVDELRVHLEKQFIEGMTWDNHGFRGWHIDHIIPCASFDLSKPEEQRKCFHFANLQPLWAHDNHVKWKNVA